MERCKATARRTGERCRRWAAPGGDFCAQHRPRVGAPAPEAVALGGEGGGLYEDCFSDEDRAALARALGDGLEEEVGVLRLLIRRALAEGRPAREVAQIVEALARLLKVQYGLKGKNVQDLDQALAAALDAIAKEIGLQC